MFHVKKEQDSPRMQRQQKVTNLVKLALASDSDSENEEIANIFNGLCISTANNEDGSVLVSQEKVIHNQESQIQIGLPLHPSSFSLSTRKPASLSRAGGFNQSVFLPIKEQTQQTLDVQQRLIQTDAKSISNVFDMLAKDGADVEETNRQFWKNETESVPQEATSIMKTNSISASAIAGPMIVDRKNQTKVTHEIYPDLTGMEIIQKKPKRSRKISVEISVTEAAYLDDHQILRNAKRKAENTDIAAPNEKKLVSNKTDAHSAYSVHHDIVNPRNLFIFKNFKELNLQQPPVAIDERYPVNLTPIAASKLHK